MLRFAISYRFYDYLISNHSRKGLSMSCELKFPNCQELLFSPELSRKRLSRAKDLLGQRMIRRFLCFALYLLGVRRNTIGESLNIPTETVKSIIKTAEKAGAPALDEHRSVLNTLDKKTKKHKGQVCP